MVQNYSAWNYVGCYSDSPSNRSYPNALNPPNKTIEACLDTARRAGYTAAGIEYGGEHASKLSAACASRAGARR